MKNKYNFKNNIINQIHCIANFIDDTTRHDDARKLLAGVVRQVQLFGNSKSVMEVKSTLMEIDCWLAGKTQLQSANDIKIALYKILSSIEFL